MQHILLYGAGGHAKVVMECIQSQGNMVSGVFDDKEGLESFFGVHALGHYKPELYPSEQLIISIGHNGVRQKIATTIAHPFGVAVHASSTVSPTALIGAGSMVLHGAIVQADARIGRHVIVNTRAVVEHDVQVGDFVHLGPGSVLCGLTSIGEGTLVGANAVVAPLVKVGKWCQISAGSSVLEDIPDYSLVMGVPGRVVKNLQNV
jgi:sugar O-acyltransferase (sialic acid O-acetyltransferase NeuD family)